MIVVRKKLDCEIRELISRQEELKANCKELEAENNRLYLLIEHILKRKKDGALGRLIVDLINHSEGVSEQLVKTRSKLKEAERLICGANND